MPGFKLDIVFRLHRWQRKAPSLFGTVLARLIRQNGLKTGLEGEPSMRSHGICLNGIECCRCSGWRKILCLREEVQRARKLKIVTRTVEN